MEIGDICFGEVKKDADSPPEYFVYKLLAKTDYLAPTLHVLMYKPIQYKPSADDIDKLEIYVYHAPFAPTAFDDATYLANRPPRPDELIGFHDHLKHINYELYAQEIGKSIDELVEEAQAHYNYGYELSDQGRFQDAIESYLKAVEIFPFYFEALDNAAFCYMDMGKYAEAIPLFEESIRINEHTHLTDFSIGECHYRLENEKEAREWFLRAKAIDPDNPINDMYLK